MLHNPSYDFNDELIPLGATAWVRMAEQWLASPPLRRWPAMSDASSNFAQTYAEARGKFLAAADAAGLDVHAHRHPLLGRDGEELAVDVARLTAPADAQRLLIVSSGLPRRGGLLRLGRAGGAAARRRLRRAAQAPAWRCCTCTRSTPGASRGGGAPRRRTST
jgi:hypothetical protein